MPAGSLAARIARRSEPWRSAERIVVRVSQGLIAVECAWVLWHLTLNAEGFPVGCDYLVSRDAAARWLSGGPFYPPVELAGPFPVHLPIVGQPYAAMMYPPVVLWLFVPFVFVPAVLWWAIPAAMVVWAFYRLPPARWTWPVVALLWLFPPAPEAVQNGNPAMWAMAIVAVGCVVAGPAVFALFKVSLAPFVLVGANRRWWWLCLGLLLLACLPFGGLWLDWLKVAQHARGSLEWYLHDWPLMAIPLVAWASRLTKADVVPVLRTLADAVRWPLVRRLPGS